MKHNLLLLSIAELYRRYPFFNEFFLSCALEAPAKDSCKTMGQWIEELEYFTLDEVGIDREELSEQLALFIENMEARLSDGAADVESITVIGGHDKSGAAENLEFTLCKGDIVSIVGPTGSGKSRLLSDIEWLAQQDTPTGRKILVNGKIPPAEWRFAMEKKLVAQLSQNMNFVMDISVADFLRIHCDSRMVKDGEQKAAAVIAAANSLAGEPMSPDTPVTALSGGQSRALMIADTAFISTSPIILIDEIENAGIDRKKAIELLVHTEKIVLIATHDPILALQADRRIVIKNGGISKVLTTTPGERQLLSELEAMNEQFTQYRERLRNGITIA
jgi:ABC-type lipoprotein export system ATPase subunit